MDYSYADFKLSFLNYDFLINYYLTVKKEKTQPTANEIKVRKDMLRLSSFSSMLTSQHHMN